MLSFCGSSWARITSASAPRNVPAAALPTRLRERTSSYPCLQPDGREDDGHEGCCRSTGGRAETVVDDEGCRCSAGGRAEVVVNAEGCRCSAGGRDEVGLSTMHGGELDGVDETSWPHIVGEVEDPWRQDVNTHMQFASLVGTPTCMLLYMNALMRMSLPSVCWSAVGVLASCDSPSSWSRRRLVPASLR